MPYPASGKNLLKLEAKSAIRIKIGQNGPDKNFEILDMASKGTFRGPQRGNRHRNAGH
jgi:hypothetical protein